MKAVGPVPVTTRATDRAFNTGVVAVVLGAVGGIVSLYYASLLSLSELVLWVVLGVPVVGFVAAVALAHWLGYADKARYRSMQYAVALNRDIED